MSKAPIGFVALNSLKKGQEDPLAALGQIREIYFKTTKATIEHDIVHAIELLKRLPSEAEREKATVYMEGLAQMRKDWGKGGKGKRTAAKRRRPQDP